MHDDGPNIASLTEKQREVLRLISQHLQAKEIARVMNIRVSTVKAHTKAVRERLNVATSREAARLFSQHEGASDTIPEGEWPSRRMAEPAADASGSGHGQDLSAPNRTLSAHELERSGDRLEDAGIPREGTPDRRHASDGTAPGSGVRTGKSDLHDRGGDSLVDGRQAEFSGRLERLSVFSWLRLIFVKAAWMLIILAGILIGVFGALQAIHNFTRYFG